MSTAYEHIVDTLRGRGGTVNENGSTAKAQCPAHDDSKPSLSIRRIEDSALLYCHAGCSTADVLGALKLQLRDLYDNPRGDTLTTYTYPKGRKVHRKADKQFPQSGNLTDDSLFHADKIGDADTVYVCEGEKDVQAIESAGAAAVSPPQGAKTPPDKFDWSPLKARHVIIVADRDDAGRKHAPQVSAHITDIAASVKIVEAKEGNDAADHIAAGHSLGEFVEVTPEPTDGAELLDNVLDALTKYVIFPSEAAAVATTLWTAATHALPAWQHATRLIIRSPQKRCGKSRLLDIVRALSFNPMAATDMSTAVIYRSIGDDERKRPTLLIDEADALFGTKSKAEQNEDLRGLLNAGFQRDRTVWRCVGPQQTPTEFQTFAMAALAAIKGLPDTVVDRAVVIALKRRRTGEKVDRFRIRRDTPPLLALREQLTGWAREGERLTHLGEVEPDMPDGVEDRQMDAWEPLIAVADAAGGHWPELARAACKDLCEVVDVDDDDIQLLEDIEKVFAAAGGTEFMASQALVNELKNLDESPWRDAELTPFRLARLLRPFDVRPGHNAARTMRGYHRTDFDDAFGRYTRPDPSARP